MYNEERKIKYIEENNNQNLNLPVVGTRIFNQIEYFEKKYKIDCCDFISTEIMDYYKSLNSNSLESLASINSILAKYTDWCLGNGYVADHQNHYREFTIELFGRCLNTGVVENKIFTRKEIEKIADDLDNDMDAAFILALFEGICGKNMCELTNLTMDNFNGNHVTLCSGRELDVSSKLYSLCLDASKATHYKAKNRDIPFIESDTVFKIINSARSKTRVANRKSLYTRLMNIKDWYDLPYLTTYNLMESGRIHMINELKTQGYTLEQILFDRMTEDRYGRIQSVQAYLVKYGKWLGE